MKGRTILIISVCFFTFCGRKNVEKVKDRYENGTPKTIFFYKNDTTDTDFIKVEYYKSGQKKEEVKLNNGKQEGKFQTWYESGNVLQIGFLKDGALYGVLTNYYDQIPQQKKIERFYKDGKMFLELRYHKNGVKMAEANFKNGRENGRSLWWYSDGSKEIEITDCWNGVETRWYRNGNKKLQGQLKEGKNTGVWLQWDSLGRPLPSIEYKE